MTFQVSLCFTVFKKNLWIYLTIFVFWIISTCSSGAEYNASFAGSLSQENVSARKRCTISTLYHELSWFSFLEMNFIYEPLYVAWRLIEVSLSIIVVVVCLFVLVKFLLCPGANLYLEQFTILHEFLKHLGHYNIIFPLYSVFASLQSGRD